MLNYSEEISQALQFTFAPESSALQFKVPFMLGSSVYGSFSRFRAAATWSEDRLLPQSLSIFLDSSSINANFLDQQVVMPGEWAGEAKVNGLELFLESDKQDVKIPLKEQVCRFKLHEQKLHLGLELEIDRPAWNSLRGLDVGVRGLLDSGPVLLIINLTWNNRSASRTFDTPLGDMKNQQIMQVANGIM